MHGKMDSLLNKLNPKRTDNKSVVNVEQVSVIGHSCDAVGWRPVAYSVPDAFERFHANVEKDVAAFISRAHPDMYNIYFYEETKEAAVKKAMTELDVQRAEHQRSIHNIRIYQDAALTDLVLYLTQLEEELKRKEETDE